MIKKLRKAVLPVAGLGTRFLPATKATAKEMLPVVDKPLIQYAVEEARAAGIEQFCMVTGRGKTALVEHFDIAYELEVTLRERNKTEALASSQATAASPAPSPPCASRCRWVSATPSGAPGPSSATTRSRSCCRTTWCWPTSPACSSSPMRITKPAATSSRSTEVPREHTNRYGILEVGTDDGRLVEVTGLVEKPDPEGRAVEPVDHRPLHPDAGGDRLSGADGARRRQRGAVDRRHGPD